MKRMKFVVLGLTIVCAGAVAYQSQFCGKDNSAKTLMVENVEALSTSETVVEVECDGNTNVCAKGVDQNTGNEFVIHGVLTIKK